MSSRTLNGRVLVGSGLSASGSLDEKPDILFMSRPGRTRNCGYRTRTDKASAAVERCFGGVFPEDDMAGRAAPLLDNAAILALANAPVPLCHSNWKLYAAGASRTAMVEAALYTDTRVVGEHELGPLKFINTMAHGHHRVELRPAIVLRFSCCWPAYGFKPVTDTTDSHYHAGDYFDEAAALASLILGIRLQAGPITRDFRLPGDPLGTPINPSGMKATPTLYPSHQDPMVPRLNELVNLANLDMMEKLPLLTPEAASVLVKAARTYQTALWFADSHPEMAWLFLVSAIDTIRRNF